MMNEDFKILINKLDAFIKRYYISNILKGLFLSAAIILSYYIIISIVEYLGNFSIPVRTIIFYLSLALLIFVFSWFILNPALRLLKIGKRISYKQASQILRNHFPEMQDKLENSLELAKMAELSGESKDIILAAIAQKSEEIKPLPFLSALPLKKSLSYAKFLLPPVAVILILLFLWPSAISEGTERIVKHRKEFIPPPPFVFQLQNENLNVRKGSDLELTLTTKGKSIPEKVWVHFNGNKLLMKEEKNNLFKYTFKGINNPLNLHFEAGEIVSDKYKINVLPSPGLLDFRIKVNPPAYTGVESSELNNQGDIDIPAGSFITWIFNTRQTKDLNIVFSDSTRLIASKSQNFFEADTSVLSSTNYSIELANEHFKTDNELKYRIHVIPDLYPEISVKQKRDSSNLNIFYFNGVISDDYGFNSLHFVYNLYRDPDSAKRIPVKFSPNVTPQEFYFARDFSSFAQKEPESVKYYFEVGDNDAINGSKKSKSKIHEFRFPGSDELSELNEETNKEIEEKVDEAKKLSESMRDDLKDLRRKLIDKDMTSWERKQNMKKINEKQEKLENLMNEINRQNKERNNMMDSYSSKKESIKEKQKQIEELMKNLMDEEMKDMMKELNELMKKNKTEDMNQLMENLEMSYEDLDKQLDNNLEILKKMDVEENIQKTIDDLDKLSKKHEELSKKTSEKSESKEKLKKEQEKHKKELEEIQKKHEETMRKNQELEDPVDMDDFKKDFEDIKKQMQESGENLEKSKEKKASEGQKKSSEEMKKLSEKMQSMLNSSMMSQNSENMEDVRQLLENLIQFSHDQENLMDKFQTVNARDPRYKEIIKEQGNLRKSFELIEDSLNTLGARVPQIGNLVRKDKLSIQKQLNNIMNIIEKGRLHKLKSKQQIVMTHANNMALLLSEVLDQMQNQMNSMASSESQCKNKNGNKPKPGMGKVKKQQQSLKKQLEQMLQMMKNGKLPGGKKSNKAKSKQLSEMLAKQEIMQQMINEMMSDQEISPNAAKMLKEINRMIEESKAELINRNVTPELLKRQNQILTRMLEAEKSEFEREIDKKRKSEEAKEHKISNPEKAFKKAAEKESFNELLEFSRLKMTPFYNKKYKDYLLKISKE